MNAPRPLSLNEQLASDQILADAYDWLCLQRRQHGANSSVWSLRQQWSRIKPQLQVQLRRGNFTPGPTVTFTDSNGKRREMREALDALVLRALARILTPQLQPHIPVACTHLRGHGGAKGAIRQLLAVLPQFPFVIKTDVLRYYASIDHHILLAQLAKYIPDPDILRLLWNSMRRISWDNGNYREHTRGIALGCPLSPLLGALYLAEVDRHLSQPNSFYVRFMDDLLLLLPSRPRLRDRVRQIHREFAKLGLRIHPDKTFIGRVSRGFEFLGYRIDLTPSGAVREKAIGGREDPAPNRAAMPSITLEISKIAERPDSLVGDQKETFRLVLKPAANTWQRFRQRCHRLYEQGVDPLHIGDYQKRWERWLDGGLGDGCCLGPNAILSR
jgi:RNA-directed DNA polymerase